MFLQRVPHQRMTNVYWGRRWVMVFDVHGSSAELVESPPFDEFTCYLQRVVTIGPGG